MPELKPRLGRFRIQVYIDDHGPPHVHVIMDGGTVKVYILEGGIRVGRIRGHLTIRQALMAGRAVANRLTECWRLWRRYHG